MGTQRPIRIDHQHGRNRVFWDTNLQQARMPLAPLCDDTLRLDAAGQAHRKARASILCLGKVCPRPPAAISAGYRHTQAMDPSDCAGRLNPKP